MNAPRDWRTGLPGVKPRCVNVIGSGGASSAHLAAWLVDRHVGRTAATKSLHIMIIDDALTGEVPQPGLPVELSTDDPLVRHALALMRQSMEAPLTVEPSTRVYSPT